MLPIGVVVHTSDSLIFPHLEQYYTFEEFERLAVLAAQKQLPHFDSLGQPIPPVTHCTLFLDSGEEVEFLLTLAFDHSVGLEDRIRCVYAAYPEQYPIFGKIQFTTH